MQISLSLTYRYNPGILDFLNQPYMYILDKLGYHYIHAKVYNLTRYSSYLTMLDSVRIYPSNSSLIFEYNDKFDPYILLLVVYTVMRKLREFQLEFCSPDYQYLEDRLVLPHGQYFYFTDKRLNFGFINSANLDIKKKKLYIQTRDKNINISLVHIQTRSLYNLKYLFGLETNSEYYQLLLIWNDLYNFANSKYDCIKLKPLLTHYCKYILNKHNILTNFLNFMKYSSNNVILRQLDEENINLTNFFIFTILAEQNDERLKSLLEVSDILLDAIDEQDMMTIINTCIITNKFKSFKYLVERNKVFSIFDAMIFDYLLLNFKKYHIKYKKFLDDLEVNTLGYTRHYVSIPDVLIKLDNQPSGHLSCVTLDGEILGKRR